MKKFLCYDTNDAASGKVPVDTKTGILTPIIDTNFVVRFFEDDDENILADKTFDEVLSAYNQGANITARFKWDGTTYLNMKLDYVQVSPSGDDNNATFSCNWGTASEGDSYVPIIVLQMIRVGDNEFCACKTYES